MFRLDLSQGLISIRLLPCFFHSFTALGLLLILITKTDAAPNVGSFKNVMTFAYLRPLQKEFANGTFRARVSVYRSQETVQSLSVARTIVFNRPRMKQIHIRQESTASCVLSVLSDRDDWILLFSANYHPTRPHSTTFPHEASSLRLSQCPQSQKQKRSFM